MQNRLQISQYLCKLHSAPTYILCRYAHAFFPTGTNLAHLSLFIHIHRSTHRYLHTPGFSVLSIADLIDVGSLRSALYSRIHNCLNVVVFSISLIHQLLLSSTTRNVVYIIGSKSHLRRYGVRKLYCKFEYRTCLLLLYDDDLVQTDRFLRSLMS